MLNEKLSALLALAMLPAKLPSYASPQPLALVLAIQLAVLLSPLLMIVLGAAAFVSPRRAKSVGMVLMVAGLVVLVLLYLPRLLSL